ncbi:hypothetical protein EIL87_12040 [Saccharopolyspora rhizosphaerae]|uniref:Uncharacterized protein n=2 Tax=Saccharopolyspora rhizosphaerae TaxID=2492662 RepID=A0A3R8R323_9PSEU|nr:hypothetical protein EIL87_12040 [Saccharopolyspora rhizosphaerae]
MTRVDFHRSGGLFAGDVLGISVLLDQLDERSRHELEDALEQADVAELARCSPITGPGADTYQYEVSVERSGRRFDVVASQTAVPDHLWPLIEWLEERALDERRR